MAVGSNWADQASIIWIKEAAIHKPAGYFSDEHNRFLIDTSDGILT
jgi:hypothetical protein